MYKRKDPSGGALRMTYGWSLDYYSIETINETVLRLLAKMKMNPHTSQLL
jgi:hypothetical protein